MTDLITDDELAPVQIYKLWKNGTITREEALEHIRDCDHAPDP